MDVFEKTIRVTASDLDELNHVNNVRYVQWVQDIAEAHWKTRATEAILESCFWVLVSHKIDYKAPAFLEDEITLKTYVSSSEGVTSVRQVEILHAKSKKQLAKSETKWCLLDKLSERPKRISAEIQQLFT